MVDLREGRAETLLSPAEIGRRLAALERLGAHPTMREAKEGHGHLSLDRAAGITILDRQSAVQNVSNTTTETSVYSKSIRARTIGSSGGLRLSFAGEFLNTSGAVDTLTFRLKFGGTTIFTWSVARGSSGAVAEYHEQIEMLLAAAASQKWTVRHLFSNQAAGTPNQMSGDGLQVGFVTSVLDTSADQTLQVTAQHSVANALTSVDVEYVILERLPPTV